MKRALVTGGAGFIGSNLVHELVRQGWLVDIVDDMSNGHIDLLKPLNFKVFLPGLCDLYTKERQANEVFIFECDFAHKEILERIQQQQYDVVFHHAANPRVAYSVENPVETTEINVMRSVSLLQACIKNVKRVVFASSCAVYGNIDMLPINESVNKKPRSPYALHKSVIEDFAKLFSELYELDIVCLRYFNIFGPGQYGDSPYSTAVSSWCNAISSGNQLRSDGDGSQSRDLCYIGDVVNANILVATAEVKFKGNCYNICSGNSITNKQILDFFIKYFDGIQVINACWRTGDVMHTLGDWTLANRDFGYKPTVNFWEGLYKTLEWWNLTPNNSK